MSQDDYEIIDCHVHLFRDVSYERAGAKLVPANRRDRDRIGTPAMLVKYMARTGITKAIFVNMLHSKEFIETSLKKLPATLSEMHRKEAEEQIKKKVAENVRQQNEWACETAKQYDQLVPFIGVQPMLGPKGMADEVEVGFRNGAKGVKIHPGANTFFPCDNNFWPCYETCQTLGLPIISDSGPFRWVPQGGGDWGQPRHFAPMLKDFPRLILVMAHLGSGYWDERIDLARQFSNVYFDTSTGFSTPMSLFLHGYRGLPEQDAARVIRKIGVERVVFGSDAPFCDPITQAEEILGLDLTEDEKQAILAGNARRILKI